MIALFPLLLAAAPVTPPPLRAVRVASASVEIVQLERISAKPPVQEVRQADRQYRDRDTMPLIEFF